MSAAGQEYPYATFLNVLFPPLKLVDVPSLVEARSDRWYNQTLCQAHRRLAASAGAAPATAVGFHEAS
jgi:hypothetical protein